jgi:hypothetical protein
MVAIDNMTSEKGCFRISKGEWTDTNHCKLVPASDDNPDAEEGAIPLDVAETLVFQAI